jgi:hypothetical protein
MASVYDAHVPRICRDRVWQGEDCTVNKPIDSFQGRPIVSQRAGRHYAEHHCFDIPLHPFPAAQNPGYEHVGQALRFCLSDLVIMKDVPARTCTARELGLDLGEQTLNAKGAAFSPLASKA